MKSSLILPRFNLPPSVNDAYWDNPFFKFDPPRGGIRTYGQLIKHVGCRKTLTSASEAYKKHVIGILDASGVTLAIRDFLKTHICVDLIFYIYRDKWLKKDGLPNRMAGDADNRIKILQDAIFTAAGVDDSAVFFSGCRKICSPGDYVIPIFNPTPEVLDEF